MKQSNNKYFEKVYKLVRTIPKGRVTTYETIGKNLGMSPRVVGYALHVNPDSVKTPCHRVVNRDGRIAPGFAFGGRDEQRKRLAEEGVEFIDGHHADLEKHFFAFN